MENPENNYIQENNQTEEHIPFEDQVHELKDIIKAQEEKVKGNQFFKQNDTNAALDCYEQAIKYCPNEETKLKAILLNNMAICYQKHSDQESVIEFTTKSIKKDEKYLKPLVIRARTYYEQEKWEESLLDYQKIIQFEMAQQDMDQYMKTIRLLEKKVEELNEIRKKEAIEGLKNIGNTILGKFGMSLNNFKLNQNENGSYNIQYQQ